MSEWLAGAEQVVDKIIAEHKKGFCSSLYTRTAMDRMFGRGRWRPLVRFQIIQADNKKRMIDNGRKTQHNARRKP